MFYYTVLTIVCVVGALLAIGIGIYRGQKHGTGDGQGIGGFFLTALFYGGLFVLPLSIMDLDKRFKHHDPICVEILNHHVVGNRWHDNYQFIVSDKGDALLLKYLEFEREDNYNKDLESYLAKPDSLTKPQLTSYRYKYKRVLGFIRSPKEKIRYCYGITDRMRKGFCEEIVETKTP